VENFLSSNLKDFDYKNLSDKNIISVIESFEITNDNNGFFIDKYLTWIKSLNSDFCSPFIINQIYSLLKNIGNLEFLNIDLLKIEQKFLVDKKCLLKMMEEQQTFSSFCDNRVINGFLQSFLNYEIYHQNLHFVIFQTIFKKSCLKMIKLLYKLVKVFQLIPPYKKNQIVSTEEFFHESLNIIKPVLDQIILTKNKIIIKNLRKNFQEFLFVFKQFLKIILNIISYKLFILNNLVQKQKGSILAKFKIFLATNSVKKNETNEIKEIKSLIKRFFIVNQDFFFDEKNKNSYTENIIKIIEKISSDKTQTPNSKQLLSILFMLIIYIFIKNILFIYDEYFSQISAAIKVLDQ
jgi:hypothetical protein